MLLNRVLYMIFQKRGFLKGAQMAVSGNKYIDLTNEAIKILGVHFSYNQKLQAQKNFLKSIINMQKV